MRWIEPHPDEVFIDIGAGDGALSVRLAPEIAHLIALEVDFDCIPRLEAVLAPFPSASVLAGDVLQVDLLEVASHCLKPGLKFRIAGNLPYNIATAIVEKLLQSRLPIEDMFFMVQYEVAQRIAAGPGSRQYGYISVFCQHHAEVRLGFRVSPACFVPRPRVSSAMISLRLKSSHLDPAIESDFEALVKAAFGHRRKKLENSLARHPLFGSVTSELLGKAGIEGSRRAEDISVPEYERLAQAYYDLTNYE
jgi:16S rRNA (adenine1518-N6/adenine1519-N6)-dimethyltransferase